MNQRGKAKRRATPREWSWETRRENELTPDYLARILEWAGLTAGEMVERAKAAHFDDFAAPPEVDDGLNMLRLVNEITRRKQLLTRVNRKRAEEIIEAVKQGEFDATTAERDNYGQSARGQRDHQALVDDIAANREGGGDE